MVLAVASAMLCVAAVAGTQWVDIERRLTPEQRHATGLDMLTVEQLALLNRLLREQADMPTGGNTAGPMASDAPARSDRFIGFNDQPIATTLVGTLEGWEPGTEFAFANGQRWKVLKGSHRLPKPLQSPAVRIVPGVMGRWFFKLDDDTPGARVYRVD
jgi:hypothetical protein